MSLWDRDKNETDAAWLGFDCYKKLGPGVRTVDAAWRKLKNIPDDVERRPPGCWFQWYTDHDWKERALAWDQHNEDVQQKAFEKRLKELGRRQANFLFRFQEIVEQRVEKLNETLHKTEAAPVTDITRVEDKDGVKTRTKVKGINLSGYSRLNHELIYTAIHACTGPFPDSGDSDDSNPQRTELPPLIIQVAEPAAGASADVVDGSSKSNIPRS